MRSGIKTAALKIGDYLKLISTPAASLDGVHAEATVPFRNHPREDILNCEFASCDVLFFCHNIAPLTGFLVHLHSM